MALPIENPNVQKYLDVVSQQLNDDELRELGQPAYGLSTYKIFKALVKRIEVLEAVAAAHGSTNPEMHERAKRAAEHTRALQRD